MILKYSVACCYLTHNHTDALSEILSRCLKLYADHGIDIYILDDSDDQATEELICDHIRNGADNLFYVDAHAAKNGDDKYLLAIRGYGLEKEYDYIWPSKDRVCFDEPFISSLCSAIDEGHDVIVGAYEYARWDVGENLEKSIYTDPCEFYRLYNVVCTNWECLIRKRSTMLDPIDWDRYVRDYRLGPENSFNQTITLFSRLSEMNDCSIRICRYTEERFISSKASSIWGKVMFELWIDKWVAANFSLPAIYDKYKTEAIKSQTNLSELFGSVEGMITFRNKGVYTPEVFEKYRNVWPFVSNIPVVHLEKIANGDYDDVLKETLIAFEQSFAEHDFKKAWWLIAANTYFGKYYDDRTYRILVGCFNRYRRDMMSRGESDVFTGISSLQNLLNRYSFVK